MDRLDAKRMQVIDALDSAVKQGRPGRLLVRQIMTPNPRTIRPDTSVLELVNLFNAKEFRHPLVADSEGRLIGVISDRDVLRCMGPGKPDTQVLANITARQIMATDLITIAPDAKLDRAVSLILDCGISCLPVIDNGELVGILTATDIYIVAHLLLQSLLATWPAEKAPLAEAAR